MDTDRDLLRRHDTDDALCRLLSALTLPCRPVISAIPPTYARQLTNPSAKELLSPADAGAATGGDASRRLGRSLATVPGERC